MFRPRVILVGFLLASGCTLSSKPLPLASMPTINTDRMLDDIKVLASDAFEGRAPGTKGENLTIDFLAERFKAAGAEPGNPDGTWIQRIPLVGITPTAQKPLVLTKGTERLSFKPHDEVVAFSERVTDDVSIENSEVVFVGYGVQAPEYQWDDFKGVDVKGKTLIVLVSDPPVPIDPAHPDILDPKMFNGRAMTYYGRWTYKFEKAAELGAAAMFIVHETGPAGYGFNVVQGFDAGRLDFVTPDKNMSQPSIKGWLSLTVATQILRRAGLDFDAVKAQARTRAFKPIALGMSASMSFSQSLRAFESRNVIAKIPGADPDRRGEHVVYLAHWDHLGIGESVDGDKIYNGARDNASGVALLIELARAFKQVTPQPKRTILFLATTGEEQGLLGSSYYAQFPLYPLTRTLAAINMDEVNVWGRTRDLTIIGLGASELDNYARAAALEQQRNIQPDAEPEKGYYFRSDHFAFAKAGVPALQTDSGIDFVDKPANYGRERRDEWTEKDYHQPSDRVKDWWDLSGAAEDGRLFFAVGYRVANADTFPAWSATSEFRAVRERALQRSR